MIDIVVGVVNLLPNNQDFKGEIRWTFSKFQLSNTFKCFSPLDFKLFLL